MKLAFSWDDGAMEDLKLFELHEKYQIPGMFFVPTRNKEGRKTLSSDIMRSVESEYISFGGHTVNHTYLTQIPFEMVEDEIKGNKDYLENALGHRITDFCLPGGKYTDEILKVVYKYYDTIRTADTMNFKYTDGPLKPSFHFYSRGLKSLMGNAYRHGSYGELVYLVTHPWKKYFNLMNDIIDWELKKDDSVVMIWGHSWELEIYQLWDALEMLMKKINNNNIRVVSYSDMFDSKC